MKENSNVSLIIICIILIIFLVSTYIYIFNLNNIRDNSQNIELYDEVNNLETSPKPDYNNETDKVLTRSVEIAKYTTKIYDNDKNRVYNIKLACKTLDKTFLKSGNEFSFNETLGSMGESDGYKKATGFDSYGNDIKVFGGGICQLSSTLYNTVLIAKLKVTERHAHSKRVYYVPKNKDATVFSGGPDLKFINNTHSDIIINASTDGNKVTVSLTKEE